MESIWTVVSLRHLDDATGAAVRVLLLFYVGVCGYSIQLLAGILSIQKTVFKNVTRAHFHKAVSSKWVKK